MAMGTGEKLKWFSADFAVGGWVAGNVDGVFALRAAFAFGGEDNWVITGSAVLAGELHDRAWTLMEN